MAYGKKPFKRYRKNTGRVMRKMVGRLVSKYQEKKLATYNLSTFASVSSTPAELNLAQIGQGSSGYQRIGRKIHIHSLMLYGTLAGGALESALDDAYNTVRMVIGLWKSATPFATASIGLSSVIARDNSARNLLVRKFVDKYIPLTITSTEKGAGDGYTPGLKVVKYYIRFKKPISITFGDDSNTYASVFPVISMVSDSIAVPSPGFTAGYCYLRYSDA